jgi:Asp-tRNA(Asn)/Glu-tRNA(Gln) amidotransferase C subunit
MVAKDGERVNLQAFNHTEWAQTKVRTKHREESVEKCHRPSDLREDESNDLENDQEQIENGPKLASGFVRDRAVAERRRK